MKFIMALFVGLATLVWGGLASINWTTSSSSTTRYLPTVLYGLSSSANFTSISTPAGYHTGIPFGNQTTTSGTSSFSPSIYFPNRNTSITTVSVSAGHTHTHSFSTTLSWRHSTTASNTTSAKPSIPTNSTVTWTISHSAGHSTHPSSRHSTTASNTTSAKPSIPTKSTITTTVSRSAGHGTGVSSGHSTTISETTSFKPSLHLPPNLTITATTSWSLSHSTSVPFANVTQTSTSTTTSAYPSVYTPPCNYTVPGNGSVAPIIWTLVRVRAFADRADQTAQYAMSVGEAPHADAVFCNTTAYSSNGKLDGFENAECRLVNWFLHKNHSIPYSFHFAWKSNLHNTVGEKGNLLVIKSNSPGVKHVCPLPPYDACWAQGLYWIPEGDIESTDRGETYDAKGVRINGTYCRTGMPECVWSEYLY